MILLYRLLKWFGVALLGIAFLLIAAFLLLLARYRIPTGPVIEQTANVQYQMIDFGQGEPHQDRFFVVEPLTGHARLFLSQGPIPFVYATEQQVKDCWPEHWRAMRESGYTMEVTYQTRKLLFADGTTPAKLVSIRKVPGSPYVTK